MVDLDALIASSQGLAPLPQSSTRLAALLGQDDWDLDDVIEVVRLDPLLTGRVLSLANSAGSAGLESISDVGQALVRIGAGPVLALALASAAKQELEVPLTVYDLSEGELWRHSVAVALAVEQARSVCRLSAPPETFAAALLHDVGKLVLARYMRAEDAEYVRCSHTVGGLNVTHAEMEILDVHHGEVGGLIARHWSLPEVIIEGITFHHDPEDAPTEEGRLIANLVSLGDAVARTVGRPDADPEEEVPPAAAQRLGITEEQFGELCLQVEGRLEEVLASYGASAA